VPINTIKYKELDEFESPKKEILREQYVFMARRLWNIITVPAAVLMAIFGIWMLILNPSLLQMSWFHLKILFLIGLGIYHFWCWKNVLKPKPLTTKPPKKPIELVKPLSIKPPSDPSALPMKPPTAPIAPMIFPNQESLSFFLEFS
jgi:hypothetical protein